MIYEIKKGNHYSAHLPKIHFGKTKLKAVFGFLDGCWFTLDTPDDYAINKLFGISYGYHHKNSARVGWTPSIEPGCIDLFFYCYINGTRFEKEFFTVEIGKKYTLTMDMSGDQVSFSIAGRTVKTTIEAVYFPLPKFKAGYILFPYVGGRKPAQIDTKILLEFLD
jgi:hypothetical protein